MYSSYEKPKTSRNGLYIGLMAFNLANIAFQVGAAVGRHSEHADEQVRNVQSYNAQILRQLSPNYDSLDGLVLTGEDDKTYTFHTSEAGRDETCTGSYEIKADQAVAMGEIACTQTTKIS